MVISNLLTKIMACPKKGKKQNKNKALEVTCYVVTIVEKTREMKIAPFVKVMSLQIQRMSLMG